ncbi:Thrombospondin type 1 repeats protein [Tyrophagus putrescentiae]|nr:Thrombospondin type 1 repeats protein [Tyrophagus putrescentiae]
MAISPNQPTLFLLNDTLTNSPVTFTAASIAKYYPENTSFWMYAMIGLGSSFMVFVALTIYLLCKPEKDSRRPNYSTYTTS